MGNKLVIVESPAKARTIGKMLGSQYTIKASMGHVRDLPARSFGVDIEHGFLPQYEETKERSKNLADLKSAAKKADEIYLAPDPDREGEAIAWHLREVLSSCNKKADFRRVTFHEITKSAISKAFQSPSELDLHKVDAQQARRVLDRIVGYMVSPLLWGRIEKGVSAGRVQSVALRLVCERERLIQNFKPEEYWNFLAEFQVPAGIFHAKLFRIGEEKVQIGNTGEAHDLEADVRNVAAWKVGNIESVPRKKYSSPPFITSTMQQAASSALGFSASITMRIAQELYEGVDVGSGGPVGLITYMRTDSVTVSREAQEAARAFITEHYGPEYVPEKAPVYKSRASAQGAHEAIRPTDVTLTPEKVKPYLDERHFRLYTLIWRRFMASQTAPALQMRTTVDVEGFARNTYTFRSVATVTTFPGFLRVYNIQEEGTDSEEEGNQHDAETLKSLTPEQACTLDKLLCEQKFTEPPYRFSEATLIKELESNGVGRPSTYATIVNTIQERKYVLKEKGKLIPTDLGFRITDYLVEHLESLFDVGFTAKMEDELDQIEAGSVQWSAMMQDFYCKFEEWLQCAKTMGAPKETKVHSLLEKMAEITQWAEVEKTPGKRAFNDKKFFTSVKNAFDSGKAISAPQWDALLRMALKYESQLADLKECASSCGFAKELEAMRAENEARLALAEEWRKKREEARKAAPSQEYLGEVMNALKAVEFAPPEKGARRFFDEKKFFQSLLDQYSKGNVLSEKQLNVLKRMVVKYKDSLPAYEKIASLMQIVPEGEGSSPENSGGTAPVPMGEVDELIGKMKEIRNWNEPKKIRGRVYDDKAFFESLAKQRASGKTLSEKQVAALKKTAAKYSVF